MINHIVGKITYVNSKFIILESNWTSYHVYIANANMFELNKNRKIYISEILKVNNKNLINREFYGFANLESKILFNSLQSVPNIGPKTALTILQNSSHALINLIQANNWQELARLPGLNTNLAKAICIALSNGNLYKSKKNTPGENNQDLQVNYSVSDLNDALLKLGYDKEEIIYSISELEKNKENLSLEISDALSNCIKFITNKQDLIQTNS